MNKTVRFPNDRLAKKDRMLEKKHVLSRSVDGFIKRLNELLRSERTERIIFSSEARILRYKLKENLVQLMFMEPEEYGQKAEELIWSKVFYSVIVKVRHLTRHGERLHETQEKYYRNHLLQGIGFYQDLSLRLQNAYHLRISRGIDFARPPPSIGDKKHRGGTLGSNLIFGCGLLDSSADPYDEEDVNEQRQKRLRIWANEALHRCLAYMGDLTRYQHDYFRDNVAGLCIAARYYHQALLICPEAGLPYNQLAALDATSGQFHMLLAVYDYWRCLSTKRPFEGARQNLNLLLDRNFKRYQDLMDKENQSNSSCTSVVANSTGVLPNSNATVPATRQPSEEQARVKDVKKLILKMLLLVQRFSKAQLEQKEILRLAQDVIAELEMCMFAVEGQSCRIYNPDQKTDGMLILHDLMRPKYVPDSLVFRSIVIFIAVWHHLSAPGSNYAARVVQAFIMTLFSTVLNQAVCRLQHGLKQALGLDEPTFPLPSPGSSDEDNQSVECGRPKKGESRECGERSDRGMFAPRRRRRLRRNLGDDGVLGSEDELEGEADLSEDEFDAEVPSDDNYSSDGRNSFLVEESEEEDEDEDDSFILDITAPTAQEHRGGLTAPTCGYGDLQAVPEEVHSNGGIGSSGASQETTESWSTEAVRALEELKKRLMLETGNHASERFLPFISAANVSDTSGVRLGPGPIAAPTATSIPNQIDCPADDNIEENSDDAFCREMSMKVANFSIETDNDVPPEDDEAPGCFVETWPEECAADLILQQQMEEEASRGELLARRFTVIGKTDLVSCSILMDAYIRSTDLLESGAEALQDALLGHFATLLNMLNHVDEAVQKGVLKLKPEVIAQLTNKDDETIEGNKSHVALQEDHQLRGFVPLSKALNSLNFSMKTNSVEEEALLRADRLLRLGHRLAHSPKLDFTFDANQGVFLGPSSLRPVGMSAVMSALQTGAPQQPEEETTINGISGTVGQRRFAASEARRNQLMRDMAQLRLKSEIQRLEASVESGQLGLDGVEVGLLPPYLVAHTQVLCSHLGAVQRLMQARRFIMVIPEVVVDHLDVLKKQDAHAREVIRFLESESHGNRYLRLQRSGEQIGSSADALPRKPWDRKRGPAADTWRWRSMLACARYFARQSGPSTSTRGLVALLWTHNEGEGLNAIQNEAVNEGILIEYFPTFYTKWKQSREKG